MKQMLSFSLTFLTSLWEKLLQLRRLLILQITTPHSPQQALNQTCTVYAPPLRVNL